jgi:hypothetical protein
VSANAAISLMGFDPFWTSENFHATCDTCLEWKKLVNEREEERESPSHVSHLACLTLKCHFPLRNLLTSLPSKRFTVHGMWTITVVRTTIVVTWGRALKDGRKTW